MLQKKRLLLVAIATVANAALFAQVQDLRESTQEPTNFSLLAPPVPAQPAYNMAMPSPWRYQKLAVFCKLDVQMERTLKIPVLFRLGDPRQVDKLEGKGPLWSAENRP